MMNQDFERKLTDLMNEAKKNRMPAVHVVLHMLLGSHTNGTQNDFAKWCCQFSPFGGRIGFNQTEIYEEFPKELDLDE
jgi:hypothetical protein